MTLTRKGNPDCFYDYTKGCWYCKTITDATIVMEQYPSESIILFERNKDGRITSEKIYYEPSMNKEPSFKHVKKGRLIQ